MLLGHSGDGPARARDPVAWHIAGLWQEFGDSEPTAPVRLHIAWVGDGDVLTTGISMIGIATHNCVEAST